MKAIKNVGRALVDRVASRIEARLTANSAVDPRTTPATKIGQLQLWHHYRTQIEAGRAPKLCQAGFRCFSQFEEDGLILFIMAALVSNELAAIIALMIILVGCVPTPAFERR